MALFVSVSRSAGSWVWLGGLAGVLLGACAESDELGLPKDPDYVGGGSSSGGTSGAPGTSGSSSATSGSAGQAPGTSGSPGTAGTGGAPTGTAGSGGMAGGGAGAGGAGGSGGADACPMDANKTEPGECGCGVPDTDCAPLQDALVHRYSFDTNANDSVGTANGVLMNGATVSAKALNLTGGANGGYLDLPNGLISSLSNATIEIWVTWTGTAGGEWQRIFDFGSSTMAEGTPGNGSKYLFLSARKFRTAYTSATPPAEVFADVTSVLPSTLTHVAVVVNDTDNVLGIYVAGLPMASAVLTEPLSAINDVNNWLGRSQFAADEYFQGTISEFRIYDAALTEAQLKTSFKMGEDTTFLKK